MYNPDLGTFNQRDPITYDSGDDNLYRYCGNNPVALVDPTGLAATDLSSLFDQYYKSHTPADGGCLKVSILDFFQWVNQQKGTRNTNTAWINRCISTAGCVGVCSIYCQNCQMPPGLSMGDIWNPKIPAPESFPKTTCFTDEASANKAAKDCPADTHGFVWAKQGMWKNGKPTLGKDGQITNPGDLGSWYTDNEGGFNYISDIGDYYVRADSASTSAKGGMGNLRICPKKVGPPLVTKVPDYRGQGGAGTPKSGEVGTMWCVTCVANA